MKAKDWGYLKFDLPIKHYNYKEYINSNQQWPVKLK